MTAVPPERPARVAIAGVMLHVAGAAAILGGVAVVAWSIPNTASVNAQFCALVAAFLPITFGALFLWGARLLWTGQSRGGAGLRIVLGGFGTIAGLPVLERFWGDGLGVDWGVALPLVAFTAICYATIWLMSGPRVQAWYDAHAQPIADENRRPFIEAG